jgi:hypothetical protein
MRLWNAQAWPSGKRFCPQIIDLGAVEIMWTKKMSSSWESSNFRKSTNRGLFSLPHRDMLSRRIKGAIPPHCANRKDHVLTLHTACTWTHGHAMR